MTLPKPRPSWNLGWLSLIVLALCGVMVLPSAAFLASVGAGGLHSSHVSVGSPLTLRASSLGSGAANGRAANALGSAPNSLLAGLSPAISRAPWVQSMTHQGPSLRPLTSLPNLALLKHPGTVVGGSVSPFYVAQPAPLGLTDFGLGATTYSYNVSRLMGEVTFAAPPNVTDPGSVSVIEPAGQALGYVGSVYEFGIQLNTVATNISIPGSDQGFFWTQNVVNWNDTGIHFVDDTFNLTSATVNPFFLAPGTIYSGCRTNAAGADRILATYGGVFQCVGGTIPISPASYPVTIQLYNNATTNANLRTQITYGFHIDEAGTGTVLSGISDRIVFNSPGAPSTPPANRPGYSIDGFDLAPAGLYRDAEMVLVGDIGGDNAVFRSMSGSIQLQYSNGSSGTWTSVPSAYNFGSDTGETSTGMADFWTPNHVLHFNQGPAMLYGLWNAVPWASVASGSIHFAGSISPSYGFVFVSNTRAPRDPWAHGSRDNLSWLPTTNAGTFSTYLPPLGAPWTTKYYVQAFAAGYQEKNGSVVTGTDTSYALSLTASPGSLTAPLYMFSNAQAASLASAVTGSSVAPYVFNGLTVNMNASFNHLNDFGFPSFVLVMAQGVTLPIYVNNTYEGSDSAAGNFYFLDYDGPGVPGIVTPAPALLGPQPDRNSGINIYGGYRDVVTNQTLAGSGYGLQVVFWQDSYAKAWNILSELAGPGVWVGDSSDTTVGVVTVTGGATGINDVGSFRTMGTSVTVSGSLSTGVEGLSSVGGTFSGINVSSRGTGVSTGADLGASAGYDPYYYLPGTTGMTVHYVTDVGSSVGANVTLSTSTAIFGVSVSRASSGVLSDGSAGMTVTAVWAQGGSLGVLLWATSHASVSHVLDWRHSVGVRLGHATHATVRGILTWNNSTGVQVDNSRGVSVDWVSASGYSLGVGVSASMFVTINHVTTRNHSVGVRFV